ncbi:MAG: manganese efflux pump [Bacilli bacterium]|nr:manganese efflux pump [Bacilli bacterium]
MHTMVIIMIAVSLSMDAFSLALAYGTLNLERKDIRLLSIIVGTYHFFMPLLGLVVGSVLLKTIKINPDVIVFVVLLVIGIQMILESFKKEETAKYMSKIELLLFGLAVSLDSFSVGIGLQAITHHYILCSLIFSLTSLFFTYLGLRLGKKLNVIFGKISTFIGGIVLLLLGLVYLF